MPTAENISRQTTNVLLPDNVSSEIWAKAVESSAFMQLAHRVKIPGTGVKIQTITGEPQAGWVGETGTKPVSKHTFGNKTITPYKMAVIEPFSEEFVRDKKALYEECVDRLPASLSKLFDTTIMSSSAPGTGFDVLGTGVTKKTILSASQTSVYNRFVAVDAEISDHDGIMDAVALSPQGKSILLDAVDQVGHPLFTPGVGSNKIGNILGADVAIAKGVYVAGAAGSPGTPAVVGVAGDFSGVRWGSVEGIKMSVSKEATLTYVNGSNETVTINLWQQNMIAIRFEIELAFAVMDKSQLVLLTGATPSA